MFIEGILIMIIGMTIVFLFLSLLYFIVSQFPRIFPFIEEQDKNIKNNFDVNEVDEKRITAVISAAVNYYYQK